MKIFYFFHLKSEDEFRAQKLGLLKPNPVSDLPRAQIPDVKLPAEYDWRHFNAVTPVKNQGQFINYSSTGVHFTKRHFLTFKCNFLEAS